MVSFYLFGWNLFLWLFRVCDRLCGCIPCLRYPRKGNTPRVYYYIYIYVLYNSRFSVIYFNLNCHKRDQLALTLFTVNLLYTYGCIEVIIALFWIHCIYILC